MNRPQQFVAKLALSAACLLPFCTLAQSPALVGYFHNWNDANAPYIPLNQVDGRYNIIDIAFATPQAGTDYKMEFIPDQVSTQTFNSQVQALQAQGKKVIISIGGATAPVSLNTSAERDTFVSTMLSIINTYGFDGIDIDLEGSSLTVTGGTISAPIDQPVINMIQAIRQIMSSYHQQHNQKLMLTMAPETAFVQGGMSAYGGIWGAYLPVIDALRDSLDILHVQLYNSGTMYGIDGNVYTQGTADFIVAMCEAVIQGFTTSGGNFAGLPASKIAAGLPACTSAAGGGFTDTATVGAAMRYLMGNGPQPGTYVLDNQVGYPDLRGMMTWSINWDAVASCGPSYEYADNFENIFGIPVHINAVTGNSLLSVFPNPVNNTLTIQGTDGSAGELTLYNAIGAIVHSKVAISKTDQIDMSALPAGIYYLKVGDHRQKVVKQ